MTNFVIGNNLSFLVAHNTVFLFFTTDCYKFKRFEQIRLVYKFSSILNRIDCSLIDHIGKIGSDQSCSRKCKCIQIYGLIHMHILGMYF